MPHKYSRDYYIIGDVIIANTAEITERLPGLLPSPARFRAVSRFARVKPVRILEMEDCVVIRPFLPGGEAEGRSSRYHASMRYT